MRNISISILLFILSIGSIKFITKDKIELKWNRKDLPIACFYENIDLDLLKAYNYAYSLVNNSLGFKAYLRCHKNIEKNSYLPLLLESMNSPDSKGLTQILSYRDSGRIRSIKISTNKITDRDILRKVLVHELLHGLWLDDNMDDNIMYPYLNHKRIEIPKETIDLLRKTYKEKL